MWDDIRCMMGTFYSADVEMPLLLSRGQSVVSHLAWPCWSQLHLRLPQPPAVSTGPPFSPWRQGSKAEKIKETRKCMLSLESHQLREF